MHEGETVQRLQITAKGKLKFGFSAEALESLDRVEAQIIDKIKAFFRIREEVISALKALPEGSRPKLQENCSGESGSERVIQCAWAS